MAKLITDVKRYELEDYLSKNAVFAMVFANCEVKLIKYFNPDNHRISFTDGTIRDLYIICDYITSYRLVEDKTNDTKQEDKKAKKRK